MWKDPLKAEPPQEVFGGPVQTPILTYGMTGRPGISRVFSPQANPSSFSAIKFIGVIYWIFRCLNFPIFRCQWLDHVNFCQFHDPKWLSKLYNFWGDQVPRALQIDKKLGTMGRFGKRRIWWRFSDGISDGARVVCCWCSCVFLFCFFAEPKKLYFDAKIFSEY